MSRKDFLSTNGAGVDGNWTIRGQKVQMLVCIYLHITVSLFPCFMYDLICSEGHMVDWPSR